MEGKTPVEVGSSNVLRQAVRLAAIYVALAVIAAATVDFFATPVFAASATVAVRDALATGNNGSYPQQLAGEHLANTYSRLLTSHETLSATIASNRLGTTSSKLARKIHVSVIPETNVIQISVEGDSAGIAVRVADSLVEVVNRKLQAEYRANTDVALQQLRRQMDSVQGQISAGYEQLAGVPDQSSSEATSLLGRIHHNEASFRDLQRRYVDLQVAFTSSGQGLIGPGADAPAEPVRPRLMMDITMAAIFALVLAAIVTYLSERADTAIRSGRAAAESLGSVLLGSVPERWSAGMKPVEGRVDTWASIRANLEFTQLDEHSRILMVCASSPGEGASQSAMNLALAAAQSGTRVVLVEANMRRPYFARALNLEGEAGLFEALQAGPETEISRFMAPSALPFSLICAPHAPVAAASQAGSPRMSALLSRLAAEYALVIVDAPSVLEGSDTLSLAKLCKATILVAAKGVTKRGLLREAGARLQSAGASIVGVVMLNESSPAREHGMQRRGRFSLPDLARLLPLRRDA